MTTREPYPERRATDHLRNVAEAAIASVPGVGGAGIELLNFYLPAGFERRRDRWFKLLDERLSDVEDRVLKDDAFHTFVLEATKAALGTHLEEKLHLLANALRSSAEIVDRGDDSFMALRFLQWVNDLEPIHFEILAAIRDDTGWGGQVAWRDVLDRVAANDDAWYQALDDLTSRRLVGTTGYNADLPVKTYGGELIWAQALGAELLRFVRLMTDDRDESAAD